MTSQTPADAPQRARALAPHTSFIVQAPAGSGKTELLIQRYLVLLAQVDDPEEIVAITFTRKAAAEMRARVIEALAAAAGPAPEAEHARVTWEIARTALARDHARDWALQAHPGRMRILTIDAFCAHIARQMPWTSSMGALPRISTDPVRHYRAAAQATLGLLSDRDADLAGPVRDLLLHLDNRFAAVETLLVEMLGRRDQWLRHVLTGSPNEVLRARLEAGLRAAVEEQLARLARLLDPQLRERILALFRYAATNLAEADPEHPLAAYRELSALPAPSSECLAVWQAIAGWLCKRDGELRKVMRQGEGFPAPSATRDPAQKALRGERKQEVEALLRAIELESSLAAQLSELLSLPPVCYDEAQWRVLAALLRLLPMAVAQLRLVFQAAGEADFIEIAAAAIEALNSGEGPSDLALRLDYRIRHLLVDEFQDTSSVQYRLLQLLTEGWSPGDGRTLFIVGDPMQSIYRFREAEVGLYLDARRAGIGQVALEPLSLTVNFRSAAPLVEWVNQEFAAILPAREEAALGAVPHMSAVPFRAEPESEVGVHAFVDDPEGRQEAERVVALVREAQGRGSVAVLVRNRGHLLEIAPRLRAAGIAYRAVEIEPLGRRMEIQDLCSLTAALQDPRDRISWLALLRAPWCGLELVDLTQLSGPAATQSIWEALYDEHRLGGLSDAGRIRALALREALAPLITGQRRRPLAEAVYSAWIRLGGPALLEAEALDNAGVFFGLLRELARNGAWIDLEELRQRIGRLYARPDPHAGEQVQLMTVHKSKGLEFDTVILPGLDRKPRGDGAQLLRWEERRGDGHDELLLAPICAREESADPVYDFIRRIHDTKGGHETGRLLYVAATRARDRLHLLARLKRDRNEELSHPHPHSFLARLWPRMAPAFEAAIEASDTLPEEVASPVPLLTRVCEPVRLRPPTDLLLPEPDAAWEAPVRPEFDWAGITARHVGTLVHRLLYRIGEVGIEDIDPAVLEQTGLWRAQLRQLGVAEGELNAGVAAVREALTNVTADPRGRWLLSGVHGEGYCEWPLTGLVAGQVGHFVIDRSFVDEEGVRWIIDYKTGHHAGGDLEAYLDREQERYRAQLEGYAHLVTELESRPIRLGLYFPRLRAWREWAPE